MPARPRPLWICPDCGQSFVTERLWHSCVRLTEADFFRGRESRQHLYRALLAFVRRLGPVTVNVSKSRISFQGRARFATLARVTRDGLVCTFWLKRRIDSPRFLRVDAYPRGDHVYWIRLTDPAQLDEELGAWLAEAYEVGMQRWTPSEPQIPAYHS